MSPTDTISETLAVDSPELQLRTKELLDIQERQIRVRTDRMFAVLVVLQWVAGIAVALLWSPSTWQGTTSSTHPHVWAAVFLGGTLTAFPLYCILRHPGTAGTRHVVAISQASMSALLIHISGGRIETHFHIFGSLAFLSFYRDRSVLVSATAVTLVDHIIRGLVWPESVYGVAAATLWRSFEHAGWVIFEVTFLFVAIKQGWREMRGIASRQAVLESTNVEIEHRVQERTEELQAAEQRTRAILETAADGIITIDHHGIVRSFNPAAETIFGYAADEVLGENVALLMPSPDREAHDGYLANYFETGDPKVIGIGREVTGLRKDGSTFPLDLSVSESTGGVFTGIVRDITERKAVDRLKSEFVSTVSHELRTPLTSIHGSLGLIEGGVGGEIPKDARNLIKIALKNSDRLVRLVNDILDMEKIESGKMDFRMQAEDLRDVVEESIRANESYAQKHEVELRFESDTESAMVLADRDRLMQVMTNLISNAAKFSPKEEPVVISLRGSDASFIVEVADRGDGIPEEFRDRIFSRFAQADSSDIRQKGGTGLGLNISKAIVEKHHGTVGFQSEVGEGTTFFFKIPAMAGASTTRDVGAETKFGSKRPRVLVCEDDPDVAHLLVLMLEHNGMTTEVAASAELAQERLSEEHFDAMTLDLQLPGMSGIEFLKGIRQNARTRDLPVVVVSATAETGQNDIGKDTLGVISWIDKPIDRDLLQEAVTAALNEGSAVRGSAKARVLHVEDDEDLAEIVGATLKPHVDVVSAATLAEATRLLETSEFDAVLLDLELPDGFGLELMSALNRGERSIPVVVFSALEPKSKVVEQVDASLVKSRTSTRQLVETLTSLIKRSVQPQSAT